MRAADLLLDFLRGILCFRINGDFGTELTRESHFFRTQVDGRNVKAMGLHVAAVDLGPEKMALARKLGAEITIDAKTQDPPKEIQKQIGGAHGVLVTAVSPIAFKQAVGMLRRGGTCVLNGLPPGEFPVSIFDVVLNGYTIRGSIVGTRLDLEQSLAFAGEGKVK